MHPSRHFVPIDFLEAGARFEPSGELGYPSWMRQQHFIFFLCFLLLPLLGCDGRSTETSQIRIGLLVDLGNAAGPSTITAAELAVRDLEEKGGLIVDGIHHRTVLKVAPTDDTPEGAARAMQKLLRQENVLAVVGPMTSLSALAAAPLAEESNIPMITQGATHPDVTRGRKYVFRATFSDPMLIDAMARFVAEDLALTHAAVLYDVSNVYSRTVAEGFEQKFTALGGRVTSESYLAGAQSFQQQIERIQAAKAEILLLPNYNKDVILQAREIRAVGLDLPFLGSDSWTPEILFGTQALEGSYLIKAWHHELAEKNPETRRFIRIYRQEKEEEPLSGTALTWDAFQLVFDAIRRADSTDSVDLRDALADTERFRGIVGEITLRGTDGDPRKAMAVLRIQGGHAVLHSVVPP